MAINYLIYMYIFFNFFKNTTNNATKKICASCSRVGFLL